MAIDIRAAENHCPFGCPATALNDLGYCRHLVGFTNDGEIVDPLAPLMRGDHDTGYKRVMGGTSVQRVLPGDKVVNPEVVLKDDKGVHRIKRFFSSRVYRETIAADAA